MIVLCCGGRDWSDFRTISEWFHDNGNKIDLVIEGGANGADAICRGTAYRMGIHVATVKALWDTYYKKAGPIRNRIMARLDPDLIVAFWDGESPGTKDMIDVGKKLGIPTTIISPRKRVLPLAI